MVSLSAAMASKVEKREFTDRWAARCCHGSLHSYRYIRVAIPGCYRPHTQMSRPFVASCRPYRYCHMPSCTVYATDPERSRTPKPKLHHSGTMTHRHTIGNPRHETPDLRRQVSTTAASQTATLLGAGYDRSQCYRMFTLVNVQ